MAVYVDGLQNYSAYDSKWRYGVSCHLIADTVQELKDFAISIGMKLEWFQPQSSPHFDLTANKRKLAVKLGAIELDRRTFVEKIQEIRAAGYP